MIQKLRSALFILALVLLGLGLLHVWGRIQLVDVILLVGGGVLLGIALRTGGGAKRPLPPSQPVSKSGG